MELGIGDTADTRIIYNFLLDSHSPVHATPYLNILIDRGINELNEQELLNLNSIGLNHNNGIISPEMVDLDLSYDTENFRFNYTLNGFDAVENFDYVLKMGEIFEQVWSFYIDTIGFDPPPVSDNGKYEINIENLSSIYFGITFKYGFGSSCNSYIKMRNTYDLSQFSTNSEEENIKVTAVHEFFHAIQFDYNCYMIDQSLWFMEATAVWSEDELFNSINDHYRYIPSWFSSPDKAIYNETIHMYGSFIYFQYLDEHLGGKETIRTCWEKARDLAASGQDITFQAIDQALSSHGSSFEDAYHRMRIANRILSNADNAGIYSYKESAGYRSVTPPPPEEYVIFHQGNVETINNQRIELYQSKYFSLETISPVKIEIENIVGDHSLHAIMKYENVDDWFIKEGSQINIDPELSLDWISLLVSAINRDNLDWKYNLRISDGYSEDFTSFSPYPNPSYGITVTIDLQIISGQNIQITIFDIGGREIWGMDRKYYEPSVSKIQWRGVNNGGKRVSSGIYFAIVQGERESFEHKIIYLK